MKFISMIVLVFAATSAFATEYASKKLSWSPMTHSGWNRTYYNCDWAEGQVESHLKTLGAQNISVSCSGGIDWNWTSPIFVRAKFDVPTNGTVSRGVTLSGSESCSFNTEFLDTVIPMFPGVAVRSRRSVCSGGRLDSWSYALTVSE